MKFIEQSYKNLHLTITKDKIDITDFNIIKSKHIQIDNLKLSLHIIGESHIIEYMIDNESFYEIFACKTIQNQNLLVSKNIKNIEEETLSNSLVNYTFNLSIEGNLKDLDFEGFDEYLEFVFPKGAKTAIGLNTSNKRINIFTLHSYENEKTYIYTHSFVERM